MPRNGSGSMSVPNSFSSGATISSSAMNANFTDVAAEITNSVAKDGQTTMTGPLKAASGSVASPSMAFGSDLDTGFYRKASGTIGVVSDGTEIGTLSPAGFTDAAGVVAKGFPAGTVMLFVQTAAPTGWTKSTAHNDKALRVVSGNASSGGSTAFTNVFSARTILQSNLPNISLTGATTSSGNHSHTYSVPVSAQVFGSAGSGSCWLASYGTLTTGGTGEHSHSVSVSLGGSGTAVDFAVQYVDVIMATKD